METYCFSQLSFHPDNVWFSNFRVVSQTRVTTSRSLSFLRFIFYLPRPKNTVLFFWELPCISSVTEFPCEVRVLLNSVIRFCPWFYVMLAYNSLNNYIRLFFLNNHISTNHCTMRRTVPGVSKFVYIFTAFHLNFI